MGKIIARKIAPDCLNIGKPTGKKRDKISDSAISDGLARVSLAERIGYTREPDVKQKAPARRDGRRRGAHARLHPASAPPPA